MGCDVHQQSSSTFSENALSPLVSQIVAPGDIVLDVSTISKVLRLGGGLRQDGDSITVTKAGRLRFSKPNKLWVEGSQRRYIPNIEDVVIGIVVDRRFESFTIDINAPTYATLPVLAFEGATRRNIPNIQGGAAIYSRVVKSHRDMNPELCCTDASGSSSGFGPLKGGYIFDCSTGLSRALLSRPMCPVLELLGKSLSFEVAVGLNGKVWVNASNPETIILVSNAIMNAEFLTPAQQHIMVRKLLQSIH